jgi:hypothetical protein
MARSAVVAGQMTPVVSVQSSLSTTSLAPKLIQANAADFSGQKTEQVFWPARHGPEPADGLIRVRIGRNVSTERNEKQA